MFEETIESETPEEVEETGITPTEESDDGSVLPMVGLILGAGAAVVGGIAAARKFHLGTRVKNFVQAGCEGFKAPIPEEVSDEKPVDKYVEVETVESSDE